MTRSDEWDDEDVCQFLRGEMMPEETVPAELEARVDAALAQRAAELRNMNWSVTAWVSVAAGVVLFAHGAAALTVTAILSRITVAVLYGFAVRSLVARTA
jgi:hypothetical protein